MRLECAQLIGPFYRLCLLMSDQKHEFLQICPRTSTPIAATFAGSSQPTAGQAMPAITSRSRLSVTARHHLTALAAFGCLLVLAGGILLPIVTLLRYSLQDSNGQFNGITNLLQLLHTPA